MELGVGGGGHFEPPAGSRGGVPEALAFSLSKSVSNGLRFDLVYMPHFGKGAQLLIAKNLGGGGGGGAKAPPPPSGALLGEMQEGTHKFKNRVP